MSPDAPAQHDHGLGITAFAGAQWLWVLLLGGVVTVAAAAMLRSVVPAQVRSADPVVGGIALGTVLLVLILAPAVVLPRPLAGAAVLATAVAAAAPAASGAWLRPLGLLAPPAVLAALAGSVAALAAAGTQAAGNPAPFVATALFAGIAGLVWLARWRPRTRHGAVLSGICGWLLAHAVLGATTVTALAALPPG